MRDTPNVPEEAAFHFLYAFLPRRGELELPPKFSTFVSFYEDVKNVLDYSSMPHMFFVDGVKKALEKFEAMKCQNVDEFVKFLDSSSFVGSGMSDIDVDPELMNQVVIDLCRDVNRPAVLQDASVMPNDPQFSNEEFQSRIKSMNKLQMLVFEGVFRNMQSSKQLLLFVTGGGGTGKSFLIQNIRELFVRRNKDLTTILLCAPTGKFFCYFGKVSLGFKFINFLHVGVAAYNIGGRTLHLTFKLSVQKNKEEGPVRRNLRMWESKNLTKDSVIHLRELYKNVSCIVIDEVSMLSPECLGQVDRRCKLIFDSKEPFGGRSVILFGDFCQLPPVCASPILISKDLDCIALWSQFDKMELVENQRQKGDQPYLNLLNSLRFGQISADERKIMDSRKNAHIADPVTFSNAMHIFTKNKDVDAFNENKLKDVCGKIYRCKAVVKCLNKVNGGPEFLPTKREDCGGLDRCLSLKVGCKVMLIRNQAVEDGLYNGALGHVHNIMEKDNVVSQVSVIFDSKDGGKKTGRKLDWLVVN